MSFSEILQISIRHPTKVHRLLTFYHQRRNQRKYAMVPSAQESAEMKRCWELLDMCSMVFSPAIRRLPGDLRAAVCLMYLVLRAADTIEDDLTLDLDIKIQLLKSFPDVLSVEGWTHTACDPKEKDSQLLAEFDVVIHELNRINPVYMKIVKDSCREMTSGMVDYLKKQSAMEDGANWKLDSLADFDLYSHYAGGLVGQGLTRLFGASGLERHWLADQETLSDSVGHLLQKIHMLRDYREDVDLGRCYWPRDVWMKHGFERVEDLSDPSREREALHVVSELIVVVLGHALDTLDFISLLRNPQIFEFVAGVGVMSALSTKLVFMNPAVFHGKVKPTKQECFAVLASLRNVNDVAKVFATMANAIRRRAQRSDPSHERIFKLTTEVYLALTTLESHNLTSTLLRSRTGIRWTALDDPSYQYNGDSCIDATPSDLASNTRRNDLRPLCLVSHLFYNLTVPIFYKSLYLTTLSHEAPIDSTSLQAPHLPALLATFSSHPDLARHTQTFISHPSTCEPFLAIAWHNVKSIFPFLVKLKRLSITPSVSGPPNIMDSLPVGTKLTHLAIHSAFTEQHMTEFIRIQPLLQDVYLPVGIPGLTLPDVHTIHCFETLLRVITTVQFPHLQNLNVQCSGVLQHPLDSGVCRRLRTVNLASPATNYVLSLLENLEVVEFLYIVLFDMHRLDLQDGGGDKLQWLVKIPSKILKYIHVRMSLRHADLIAAGIDRLFEKHSNLVVLDLGDIIYPPSPNKPVDRRIRLYSDGDDSSQGGSGGGFKLVTGLKIIQAEVFHPWWEMPQIKNDVDEAFAARKCVVNPIALNSDRAQASRNA
ncbi:hypothetical protein ONZ45_g9803 [Pleurotus djamor]|nr:hypothetical protein ONZ45_g9803 [Pleurotus djamor]